MENPANDDSFTLVTAVLLAVCAALTQSQRQSISDELLAQASRLNEAAEDAPAQFAALTLTALAAGARGDPEAAAALFDLRKSLQSRGAE